MVQLVNWQGQSGADYQFEILEPDNEPKSVAGLYIYARSETGGWRAIYIGQAKDLKDRLSNHNKMDCIERNGATHVHLAVVSGGEDTRRHYEADLIARWNPPCNEQGVQR